MSENEERTATGDREADEGWQAREILIAVVIFFLIIALAIVGFFVYQAKKTPPLVEGDMAPEFTLPMLGDGDVSLSDYRGKVLLINIWATWCEPCRDEMPYIESQYENFKDQPFEVLAINQDRRGEEDVAPFAQDFGLTFPILLDRDKEVGKLYQVSKFPESFIVDKNGVIVAHVVGQLSTQDFQLIDHLLKAQ